MKIRPLYDRIVVKRTEEKQQMQGGLHIPDSAQEKPQEADVKAVGKGKRLDDGKIVPLDVKVGDRVRRGQPIAALGMSGDSDWLPHVHYQLMDSCDFLDAEGLPSYFTGFTRAGFKGGPETRGQVDTGDILFVPVRKP